MAWEMSGTWDRRFWPLAEAFRDNFDQGLELGASLAVTWRGRTVVDVESFANEPLPHVRQLGGE